MRNDRGTLIEGYAALFGVPDEMGDVVRAGAFSRTLRQTGPPRMLLQHQPGLEVGTWTRAEETSAGLFLRGMVTHTDALSALGDGLRGLSIGFKPLRWTPRVPEGRELIEIGLLEVSLVRSPMQPHAQFQQLSPKQAA